MAIRNLPEPSGGFTAYPDGRRAWTGTRHPSWAAGRGSYHGTARSYSNLHAVDYHAVSIRLPRRLRRGRRDGCIYLPAVREVLSGTIRIDISPELIRAQMRGAARDIVRSAYLWAHTLNHQLPHRPALIEQWTDALRAGDQERAAEIDARFRSAELP